MSRSRIEADHRERLLFAIVVGAVLVYLILRAALVPLVHDEANTFFYYVHNGTWVPFAAHWDAGNHVLAMAVGNITTALFGPSTFSLRIFALLSFLIYAWYVWRVGRSMASAVVRWCTWLALLATPFVIEFFALFRGYGPSVALLMMSLYHLTEAWRTGGARHAVIAPIALGLAVTANLSLLPMWAAGMVMLLVLAWRSPTQGAWRVAGLIIGVLPGAVMVFFAFGLRERELLYHGNMQGVFNGSLASLVEVVLGTDHPLPRIVITLLFLIMLVAMLWSWRSGDRGMGTLLLLTTVGLLIAELLARKVLGELFDVLYPTYRAAMHWVPLFLLGLVLALDRLSIKACYLRWAALLILLLPFRTVQVANTRFVTNWSGEHLPVSLYDAALAMQGAAARPQLISAPGTLAPIWDHYSLVHGDQALMLDVRNAQDELADLILGLESTLPASGFPTVLEARTNGLIEGGTPFQWRIWADTVWTSPQGQREYATVLERDLTGLQGAPMLFTFTGVLSGPPQERGELLLVVELRDAAGANLHYHTYPVHRPWPHGRRLPLRLAHSFPLVPPEADRLVSYFWAPGGRVYAVDAAMATIMRTDDPD